MIQQAISDLGLDPARSAIIGDKMSDIEAGTAAGLGLRILVAARPYGRYEKTALHEVAPISTKRSRCCGPALRPPRPIGGSDIPEGAGDSTLELAVALGHYHG